MRESISARDAVNIEHAPSASAEVRTLIEELEGELSRHYAPNQRHGLSLDAIFQPNVRFFIARRSGEAVGCGGIALFEDFGEIKRMYVRPAARGSGAADAVLAALIAEARRSGITRLRLETGIHQAAATRFYRRCGFESCGPFEPYSSMPADAIATSVFMEMRISTEEIA